jgi:hypothetical protein
MLPAFFMTIHWSLFAPGLLLLLFPADRLLSRIVKLRSFEGFLTLENSPSHRRWWLVPALWLDPIRSCLGLLVLRSALDLPLTKWALIPKPAYWLMNGVLILAVLSQVFTRREQNVLLAPVGFLVGVVAALVPWPVSVIAFAMAAAALFALRHFSAFFSIAAAMVAIVGLLLDAGAPWIMPAMAALVLPVVVGFLAGSTLELPTCDDIGPLPPFKSTQPGETRETSNDHLSCTNQTSIFSRHVD